MGHVTALGSTVDEALDRARTAADRLRWADAEAEAPAAAEAADGRKEGQR